MPMSIAIPIRKRSNSKRRPQFVSPGLQSLALYDSSLLIYVANVDLGAGSQLTTFYAADGAATTVAPGSCTNTTTTETCTLNFTTTPGPHKFDLVAYPAQQGGTPPPCPVDVCSPVGFNGVISSEGELSVNLNGGPNPGATLRMLGVASGAVIDGGTSSVQLAYNTATPFAYQVLDSASAQILTPGDYDNGPVTWNVSPFGIVTIDQSSNSTPPSSPGDQTLTVTCTNPAGGAATITVGANGAPNTNYAAALVYSSANYWGGGALAALNVSCNPM
ncbi:MAG TPA: hypothetical protein VHS78_10545 [Candidatus Elarobacter sp.]|nr:hypothetical protein [Candidatus Elarobacter sp.]